MLTATVFLFLNAYIRCSFGSVCEPGIKPANQSLMDVLQRRSWEFEACWDFKFCSPVLDNTAYINTIIIPDFTKLLQSYWRQYTKGFFYKLTKTKMQKCSGTRWDVLGFIHAMFSHFGWLLPHSLTCYLEVSNRRQNETHTCLEWNWINLPSLEILEKISAHNSAIYII